MLPDELSHPESDAARVIAADDVGSSRVVSSTGQFYASGVRRPEFRGARGMTVLSGRPRNRNLRATAGAAVCPCNCNYINYLA
jgi:hypothetical protein